MKVCQQIDFMNSRLFHRVIQEELRDVAIMEVPPLTPLSVITEQNYKMAEQLVKMLAIIGDQIEDDLEFRE